MCTFTGSGGFAHVHAWANPVIFGSSTLYCVCMWFVFGLCACVKMHIYADMFRGMPTCPTEGVFLTAGEWAACTGMAWQRWSWSVWGRALDSLAAELPQRAAEPLASSLA